MFLFVFQPTRLNRIDFQRLTFHFLSNKSIYFLKIGQNQGFETISVQDDYFGKYGIQADVIF